MYQLAVLDAMRLVGVLSQAALLVGLVVGEVALEPYRLGLALEREDMGNDAVEEPAIVGDDDRAAAEVEQRLFQRTQGFDIEVVGRFIEQQQVAAALQQLRQVHAVAFAAGEVGDALLLVRALEVEAPAIGARRHLGLADLQDVMAAGDFIPNGLLAVERIA